MVPLQRIENESAIVFCMPAIHVVTSGLPLDVSTF